MLKKNGQLMMMEQKATKILTFIFFILLTVSCNSTKIIPKENIYGTWVDVENENLKIIIDSLSNELVVDYSKTGGKVFKSNFQLQNENEITSDIISKGAKFIIDEKSFLKIYPLVKEYNKDIESIYVLRFKKIK